ncbi:Rab GTPase-activating protein MSB3 NDAI_0A06090 [Naumovozyma dairenensis CBS 421]|uniref:Rab-GAP TBC domain-containing protein n=1 Tax=Naumovozyma dairenensis (strain ATCC 10597 / BCRC 20456 / CBS 421 / NBRC 0211 / NRRL Y-12639) TaxID=1071378 RepID=G0W4M6_NAUDC|nr:hypothetical protein NDAI_0A06090 [Naumovozyma dairenensis CBS 421]CCD22764.1 hypothetical protein NDAI_0A06090 [Naumovozyma dairenensis CBS 421]
MSKDETTIKKMLVDHKIDGPLAAKGFGPKYSLRSPSVPNLHAKVYTEYNMSDPTVGNATGGQGTSINEEDGTLSVIDMYGDDDNDIDDIVSSRAINLGSGNDDGNDADDLRSSTQSENIFNTTSINNSIDKPNGTGTGKNVQQDAQHNDRYGFKKQNNSISESDYDRWWLDYSKYCIRRKHKWQLLLEKSGLPIVDDSPIRFPPKSEKLKRYVRKGIPAEWRGNAWWYFARGQEKLNKHKGLYDKLLVKVDKMTSQNKNDKTYPDLDIIERDLNRTFPDNIHFQKEVFQNGEPPMIKSLRRVLVSFSLYNPKIGYCQSMNFIAGLLLLFLDEERAFWMLVIITSRYLPGVHDINLEGVNIDQGVLMLCVKEYLPEIWTYIYPNHSDTTVDTESNRRTMSSVPHKTQSSMMKNNFLYKLPPITLCTASWFMSCFIGVLPIETTLRIWDCMFYEESHFLFKASLSILKLSEHDLLKHTKKRYHSSSRLPYSITGSNHNSSGDLLNNKMHQDENDMEIFQVIQTFPKKLLNPNDIFDKIIFKKKFSFNRLDQEEIDRCRKYVTTQRNKYKRYVELIGNDDKTSEESSATLVNKENLDKTQDADDIINGALSSEVYGFKRNLTGVHWNNSLKEKVRQMKKKIDGDE